MGTSKVIAIEKISLEIQYKDVMCILGRLYSFKRFLFYKSIIVCVCNFNMQKVLQIFKMNITNE